MESIGCFCSAFRTRRSKCHTERLFGERPAGIRRVVGPRHEAFRRKLPRVLEKPRDVSFRNEPVPQSRPDDGHHRCGRLGARPGLGEEEVLPVYDERQTTRSARLLSIGEEGVELVAEPVHVIQSTVVLGWPNSTKHIRFRIRLSIFDIPWLSHPRSGPRRQKQGSIMDTDRLCQP